ncbi:hypothetical protein B0T22DRAFT_45655 [Podospora appendiculata]|uniref:ER membrane protein complex subunit 1 n=1 Tax=Podospora appendiculata TaxID=314037 RepID=A0AAE0XHL4_9PEZI|nr:hypothetical protein B0T22DRAFT_45655 [Podospora appendiculata]
MLPPPLSAFLLLALPSAVRAVFQDEVGHIDYHYELLGVPQRETTFFHRPRRDAKASLLYTLSDVGVLGAVNPTSGAVLWRHLLNSTAQDTGGFLRAGEGENWVASALGHSVHAWDAVTGRNKFWADFDGEVKDLEMMEMTENHRKDVLALFDEHDSTVLRRLSGNDGSLVWEFKENTNDTPLQVSTNVEKVFVISLRGSAGAYNLKVSTLDTLTGKRLDEFVLGSKSDVHSREDVMFVGANSAAPIVAWTDDSLTKLRVNVLGTKSRQEFALPADTLAIEIHAPHLVQSQPHFLVHSKTAAGNTADVYHVDLKTNTITKAYNIPLQHGAGAFSTSSENANVYFTRITEGELVLLSSSSPDVIARWPLEAGEPKTHPVHGVSEVVKKTGGAEITYAVRSAVVTSTYDWVLIQNGDVAWTRPEGLTGAVAAVFAEIPESEELAKSLEQEAHSNPWAAYIHRVKRHVSDLQHLPEYLGSIPTRLIASVLGTEVSPKAGKLSRDSFGFHKLAILATKRGMIYGLDVGNKGKVLWATKAFDIAKGSTWNITGIQAHDSIGEVTIHGSNKDYVVFKSDTGKILHEGAPDAQARTQSTAALDNPHDPLSSHLLLPVGPNGEIMDIPSEWAPKKTIVTRGSAGEDLKGVIFVPNGTVSSPLTSWTFSLPQGQRVAHIAARPSHDAIASIGRVLGDRSVKYKYLNPNTLVLAAADDSASTLTVYLLDTISGQVLSSTKYEGVDTSKSIECAMAENWFVCSFFGEYALRDNPTQSLKGYQIAVSDLYESDEANDRGPLGDAPSFSSLDPIDSPAGVALPSVVSQSYILGAPIAALQVTQTRQGISSRQVLAYLPTTHGIVGLPRFLLEPRRPVGRDATPAEAEEGLMKYHPVIEIDPKSVITHERDVLGVRKIIVAPTIVESTSLVFAYGIDVFGTRVAPSFLFDILGKGFNKVTLIGTVLAIAAGVFGLAPMVRRKQIDARWKAPM